MHIAIDLILIAIIGFCGWQGYKRGIVGSVMVVLFIIISTYSAGLLTNAYSYEFTNMFQPFISGYFDRVQSKAVESIVPEDMQSLSVEDLFMVDSSMEQELSKQIFIELGIYEARAESLSQRYMEYKEESEKSFSKAMTDILVELFCVVLVFTISFLLILIAFTVIYNIIHLSFKLPGLKIVDDIGGSVLGVVQGILLVIMLTWLMGYMGVLLPDNLVEKSHVLEFFVRYNPAVKWTGA